MCWMIYIIHRGHPLIPVFKSKVCFLLQKRPATCFFFYSGPGQAKICICTNHQKKITLYGIFFSFFFLTPTHQPTQLPDREAGTRHLCSLILAALHDMSRSWRVAASHNDIWCTCLSVACWAGEGKGRAIFGGGGGCSSKDLHTQRPRGCWSPSVPRFPASPFWSGRLLGGIALETGGILLVGVKLKGQNCIAGTT